MTKVVRPYFDLIEGALSRIEGYRPSDEATFLADSMIQDAVMMRLQEIRENLARIRRLDESWFDGRTPESWYKLIGLRNVISHGYESIDFTVIWHILAEELPAFAESIESAKTRLG